MRVRDVIDQIRDATSTLDDMSGKAINTLFTNRAIVGRLTFALDKYASQTFALEDIYSFPLSTELQTVDAPPRVLRTKTYRMIVVYFQGRKWIMNMPDLNKVETYFPYDIQGTTSWVLPWKNELYMFPTSGFTPVTTTLTEGITDADTVIPVVTTSGLPLKSGRITIGTEKIRYKYMDETTLYACDRGIEDTTAAAHLKGAELEENNCHIFYYKRHFEIPITGPDFIEKSVLDREMEVPEDHIEIIVDYTSWKLLAKVDTNRAAQYKVNFDEWLEKVKYQIIEGRSQISNAGTIRNEFWFEGSHPMQTGF